MYRPFYALIVLLEAITGSLLLVKSAQSETIWHERDPWPASIVIHAWPLDEVTELDLYGECVGIEDSAENHCLAGCQAARQIGITTVPWCAAEMSVCAGTALLGTGYDAAYDFSMFDGEYLDVARSQVRIDDLSRAEGAAAPARSSLVDGPAPTRYIHFDGCFGGEFAAPVDTRPWWARGKSAVANDVVGDVEAEGEVDASASEESPAVSADEARDACRAIDTAAIRMGEVARLAWRQAWQPYLQLPLVATRSNEGRALSPVEADEACRGLGVAANQVGEWITVSWVSCWAPYTHCPLLVESSLPSVDQLARTFHAIYDEVAQRVANERPEDTLVQVANALDQMSVELQIAAQQLRHIAAERLAAKEASHIARRGK